MTNIDNKILNRDEMMEEDPPENVAAFHNMLCNACQKQNDGECIKEDAECPIVTVARAYRRGG